jgi:hypothetical protein
MRNYDICTIQNVPGGKANILGGHSIGHSKQKVYMYMCPIPNGFRVELWMLSPAKWNVQMHSDEQHAMSSHESQNALMLTVEFSKMYYAT